MMGTLASVLATKNIRTHSHLYRADVEGDIEAVDDVLKITVIRVQYRLLLPSEQEENARWAFEHYIEKCPGAMSVTGCIRIEHTLELAPET